MAPKKRDMLGEFLLLQRGSEDMAQVSDSQRECTLVSTHCKLHPQDVTMFPWAALLRQAQLEKFQEWQVPAP